MVADEAMQDARTPTPWVQVTALSHVGLVRDHNEDSLVVGPWTLCATVTETPQTLAFPVGSPLVVAVADGLGGHPGGEVASALVVRKLADDGSALVDEAAVRHALQACNRTVYGAARDPRLVAMGTTVAGVVVTDNRLLVFNVGDSRVYRSDGAGLHQLSVDDSPPLAPGERHTVLVTQTLGGQPAYAAIDPHVGSVPLETGARYLVCSDGLTDPVPDEAIAELIGEADASRAAYELWRAAIEAGGPDNITLAIVRVGS